MTEARAQPQAPPPPQAQTSEAEQAALIGAAIAGAGAAGSGASASVTAVGAVAPVMLGAFFPAFLVGGGGSLAASAAVEVSRVVLARLPKRAEGQDGEAEYVEEMTFRGLYALAALKRIEAALSEVDSANPEEIEDRLSAAMRAEKRHFQRHLQAQKQRVASRSRLREAVERWGEVVSWVHGHPKEPRPNHVAADGRNFRPKDGPPVLTKAMPGVLPGCTCTTGPPKPGATMMLGSMREG